MKKTKILIADDNAELVSGLQIQLLVHGYEVVTCTNADLAVAHAQKEQPDVMVVDIWMDKGNQLILNPSGNGFSVLERLAKIPEIKGIPLIYITGANSTQLDLRARQMGAYGLIHKPVSFNELLKMIEKAVKENPRSRQTSVDAAVSSDAEMASAAGVPDIPEAA